MRLVEKLTSGAPDHRPDVRHLQQAFLASGKESRQVSEVLREIPRRSFADVADPERVDKSLERGLLRVLERRDQVCGRLVAHPIQAGKLGGGKPVKVGRRAHEIELHQLIDDLVAQALDVHGAPAGKVQQRLLALSGTKKTAAAAG